MPNDRKLSNNKGFAICRFLWHKTKSSKTNRVPSETKSGDLVRLVNEVVAGTKISEAKSAEMKMEINKRVVPPFNSCVLRSFSRLS